MGGKILDYEAKRILNEGYLNGKNEAQLQAKREQENNIRNFCKMGLSEAEILQGFNNMDEIEVKRIIHETSLS